MINRARVLKRTMFFLGETSVYNNNDTETYKMAEFLLDGIIEQLGYDESFLFNAVETDLLEIPGKSNYYNIPYDFLSLITSNVPMTRIGNFFKAESKPKVLYCRKMNFNDFPINMETLIVMNLSLEMSRSHPSFNEKTNYFENLYNIEKGKVLSTQAYNLNEWILEDK